MGPSPCPTRGPNRLPSGVCRIHRIFAARGDVQGRSCGAQGGHDVAVYPSVVEVGIVVAGRAGPSRLEKADSPFQGLALFVSVRHDSSPDRRSSPARIHQSTVRTGNASHVRFSTMLVEEAKIERAVRPAGCGARLLLNFVPPGDGRPRLRDGPSYNPTDHGGARLGEGRAFWADLGGNNAVARVAELLAVAVLGMVVYGAFSTNLDARLGSMDLSDGVRSELEAAKPNLGASRRPVDVIANRAETRPSFGAVLAIMRSDPATTYNLARSSAKCSRKRGRRPGTPSSPAGSQTLQSRGSCPTAGSTGSSPGGWVSRRGLVLRPLGEQPRGRKADGAGEDRADDGGVDEDLQHRDVRGQAEDSFQGVVGVGEGDQAAQRL